MALNFPDSPTLNQVYTDSTSGFSYQWNGTVWISYTPASTGNIRVLDDISGSFNGITTSFPLSVGGTSYTPPNPFQLLIGLGGIMQSPTRSFSVSGSNIVFHNAPETGLEFYGNVLGDVAFVSTPGAPNKSVQYNDGGRFGGVQSLIYNDIANSLELSGSSSSALLNINQTGGGHALTVEDLCVAGTGYVGLGSTAPTAKIDIIASSQQALKIRSTSGSGNIVSIENEANDTQPIIFDVQGNLGINTITATEKLSVYGNVAVNGDIRAVDSITSQYVGFQAPLLDANYTYVLPNSYGVEGQVLTSNGAGGLSWTSNVGMSSSNIVAGTGVSVTYTTVSGQTRATISNTGVGRIIAGTGITISPSTGAGDVTISAISSGEAPAAPYPFTTRGFSIPI